MTSPSPGSRLDRLVDAVVTDGERCGVVAELLDTGRSPVQGGLAVAVIGIPDWTARDLVLHLGSVHRWVTGILRAGCAGDTSPPQRPQLPEHELHGSDLHGWFALGLTELVATLRTTDPATPTWHMSPAAGTARDWARRQAAEHLVHRLDLESTAGVEHAAVDPVVATDGVDELLTVMLARWARTEPLVSANAHITVQATDGERSWHVTIQDGHVAVGAPAEADAVLAGTADQLLLRLWGRPADVTVTGSSAAECLLRGR